MKKLLLAAVLAFSTPLAFAHQVSIWWTASTDSTVATPGTVTVLRAQGLCSATNLVFTSISTTAPASTTQAAPFLDTAVQGGFTYCYEVEAVIGANTSAPSNTWGTLIQVAVPTNVQGSAQ